MMRNALAFTFVILLCLNSPGLGTIINVPGDYPSIQQGIDAAANGDTVLVEPGTYTESINFTGKNIALGSLYLTTGDASYIYSTIIDGGSSGSVVRFESGEYVTAKMVGLTIQNGFANSGGGIYCSRSQPTITDNNIFANDAAGFGGGVYCDSSSYPVFERNIIIGNSADWGGGGFCINNSAPILRQNIVLDNNCIAFGGGILCNLYATPEIVNNTFSGNFAYFGGAICFLNQSYPTITNSIFWGDSSFAGGDEFYGDGSSSPTVNYCDIEDLLFPGQGNFQDDPLFRDPESGDFHLMATECGDQDNSPCIDAGDPYLADLILDCSWGLGGQVSDLGAYGGGDSLTVGIAGNVSSLPGKYELLQNFPNPFNSGTTIKFKIVEPMETKLSIYDLLGREVRILIDSYKQAGEYTATFDAAGLPSGVYYYRLQVGEAVDTKRMVLLK